MLISKHMRQVYYFQSSHYCANLKFADKKGMMKRDWLWKGDQKAIWSVSVSVNFKFFFGSQTILDCQRFFLAIVIMTQPNQCQFCMGSGLWKCDYEILVKLGDEDITQMGGIPKKGKWFEKGVIPFTDYEAWSELL